MSHETFLDISKIADEIAREATGTQQAEPEKSAEEEFFNMPTHAAGARVLNQALKNQVIYDLDTKVWYERTAAGYYNKIEDMQSRASQILDEVVVRTLDSIVGNLKGPALQAAYMRAGTARRRAQTRDFVNNVLSFFAETAQVKSLGTLWNSTPETLATMTGILDFSSDEIIVRPPREGEYFRDPLPVDAEEVLTADVAPAFELALLDYFPDREIKRTAIECLSLAVANKGSRVFSLWHGEAGANGKNTLLDILRTVLPGRVGTISAAAITRGPDGGAKRFGAAELEGKLFAAIDEVVGAFDISEIKRLTGASTFSIERKGLNPYEITQRWALAALTNKLPSFSPATDAAFLQRLIIIPFDTVFYFNDVQKDEYLKLGITESRLKPAADKEGMLKRIEDERPAILKFLIDAYMKMRKSGGRPYECARSLQLKQAYANANDLVAQFFLEHFERNETGRVEYSRLMELWKEYTGDKNASVRDVTRKMVDRFPWIQKKKSHGLHYLVGIIESENNDPDEPKEEQKADSLFSGCRGAENGNFNFKEEKWQKGSSELKIPQFGTPAPETSKIPEKVAELDCETAVDSNDSMENNTSSSSNQLKEGPSDLETASIIYDLLISMYEEHAQNRKSAGLSEAGARVELNEWRLRAGSRGIFRERFEKAYRALLANGLVAFDDPHVTIQGGTG